MKVFSVKLEQLSVFLLAIILGVGIVSTWRGAKKTVPAMYPVMDKKIIIDAGHGGWDPGKKGTKGEDEKDINLRVAEKLQKYLEQSGATVFVTRLEDEALGQKKQGDMKERKLIANESGGDILISIHQNAFPQTAPKGAQVFYHNRSEEGKILAACIQASLKTSVDGENKRESKENKSYYILRTTTIPAVIVECGFLSNPTEEQKLNEEGYQESVAWAIYKGIVDYFSQGAAV